jgi:hypothetical protein
MPKSLKKQEQKINKKIESEFKDGLTNSYELGPRNFSSLFEN